MTLDHSNKTELSVDDQRFSGECRNHADTHFSEPAQENAAIQDEAIGINEAASAPTLDVTFGADLDSDDGEDKDLAYFRNAAERERDVPYTSQEPQAGSSGGGGRVRDTEVAIGGEPPEKFQFNVAKLAREIREALDQATEGTLTACSKFVEAEAWLDEMAREDLYRQLPWSPPRRSVARVVGKACDGRFKDPEIRKILPPSISHLYELAILQPERFSAAVKADQIRQDMTREDVLRLKPRRPRAKQTGYLLRTLWRDEPLSSDEEADFDGRLKALCAPLRIRALVPKRRTPGGEGKHAVG